MEAERRDFKMMFENIIVENHVCFSDWRRANGYLSREKLLNKLVNEMSTEEIEELWEEIVEEFYGDCDDCDVVPIMDE
jgi:hypothetical protein